MVLYAKKRNFHDIYSLFKFGICAFLSFFCISCFTSVSLGKGQRQLCSMSQSLEGVVGTGKDSCLSKPGAS